MPETGKLVNCDWTWRIQLGIFCGFRFWKVSSPMITVLETDLSDIAAEKWEQKSSMPFQIAVKGFVDDPASVVRTSQGSSTPTNVGVPIGMVHPTNKLAHHRGRLGFDWRLNGGSSEFGTIKRFPKNP